MELAFHKFQAIGNDYILFDALGRSLEFTPDAARGLCDRRFGIGTDGLLIASGGVDGEPFSMEIINSDGSIAQMCGNGLRSFVKYLVDAGYGRAGEYIAVKTRAGMRGGELLHTAGRVSTVRVNVGVPQIVERDRLLGDRAYDVVNVGNMHAVHQVSEGEDPVSLALNIGPLVEKLWPDGINVGFFSMRGTGAFELAVWERGAGYTRACGTGATAACFAATERGLFPLGTHVSVVQPGGDLELVISSDREALLQGESEAVFSGTVTLHG